MKWTIRIQRRSGARDYQLDLCSPLPQRAEHHRLRFLLDNQASEADVVEISKGLFSVLLGGRSYEVRVTPSANILPQSPGEYRYVVNVGSRRYSIEVEDPRGRRQASTAAPQGQQEILAPMPGKIVKMLVSENQEVRRDQGLLVIEAMKMQNELRAPRSGQVEKIYVTEGAGVETGTKLVRLA